jgi:hypothetical protein
VRTCPGEDDGASLLLAITKSRMQAGKKLVKFVREDLKEL